MRQLEEENLQLEGLVADLSLDMAMLQDVLTKKADAAPPCANGSGIYRPDTVSALPPDDFLSLNFSL